PALISHKLDGADCRRQLLPQSTRSETVHIYSILFQRVGRTESHGYSEHCTAKGRPDRAPARRDPPAALQLSHRAELRALGAPLPALLRQARPGGAGGGRDLGVPRASRAGPLGVPLDAESSALCIAPSLRSGAGHAAALGAGVRARQAWG